MERYHRDALSFSEQVRANYQEQRSRGLNANRDTPCAECTLLLLYPRFGHKLSLLAKKNGFGCCRLISSSSAVLYCLISLQP